MQNQHKPVLIFAQSGRFLAQSATQAGFRVWVADCFGDQETLSTADRWQHLPPLSDLSENDALSYISDLSQGDECLLICGSGIESNYQTLEKLPANIKLIGNSFETIHAVKTPQIFFKLLNQLKLPYPITVFIPPEDTSNWLVKSASGMGGSHIQYLANLTIASKPEHYFQKFIRGASGSVLFLANGLQAQIVNINKQFFSSVEHMNFQLGGIETPWLIPKHIKEDLELALNKLTNSVHLLGLNSLDFIITTENELLLLEINPRPSASAELANNKAELFQHHLNACQGILPSPTISLSHDNASFHTIFAMTDLIIPDQMSWPSECSDLPRSGTSISAGDPICTSIVHSKIAHDCNERHITIKKKIFDQIPPIT